MDSAPNSIAQSVDKGSMAEPVTRHAPDPGTGMFRPLLLIKVESQAESIQNPTNSLREIDENNQYVLRVVESCRECAQCIGGPISRITQWMH